MKKLVFIAPAVFALAALSSSFVPTNTQAMFLEPEMRTEQVFDVPFVSGMNRAAYDGQMVPPPQSGSPIFIERGMRGQIYGVEEVAPSYPGFDNSGFRYNGTYNDPEIMTPPSRRGVSRSDPEYFGGGYMHSAQFGSPEMMQRGMRGGAESWDSPGLKKPMSDSSYYKSSTSGRNWGCDNNERGMGWDKYEDEGQNGRFGSRNYEDRFDGDRKAFHKNYQNERRGKSVNAEIETRGNAGNMGLLLVIGSLIGLIIGLAIGQKEAFWVSKKKASSEKK